MKKMTMKYNGKCSVCGTVINRGTEVAFEMNMSSDKKREWRFFCGKACFEKDGLNFTSDNNKEAV